jgi:hypothetical protein
LSTAPTAVRSPATGVSSWSDPPPGTCVTVPFRMVPVICDPRTYR